MSENPSTKELTNLMLFFGRIPENYIKSLQSYPWIYFNDVSEVKLDYSVATMNKNEPTLFSYDLTLNSEKNDYLDKRCRALESAIRNLFWKEAKIQVKIKGKEVYKSED